MARSFDQRKILFPRDPVKRPADPVHQPGIGFLRIREESAGEGRIDGDRAHAFNGHAHLVDHVEEVGVLIDPVPLNFDVALADRLDETDARIKILQRGKQAEAGGGFAVVHARGGDKNALRDDVRRLGEERQRRLVEWVWVGHFGYWIPESGKKERKA